MSESLLYLYLFYITRKKKNNLVHKTDIFRSGWKQLNFHGWKMGGYYYWDENQARKKHISAVKKLNVLPQKRKNTFSTGYRPNPSEFEHACYIHSRMSPLLFPDAVQPRQTWTSYAETCRQISGDTCMCLCMSPYVYTFEDPSHFPLKFHCKSAEFFYTVTHGPKSTLGYHNIIHRL